LAAKVATIPVASRDQLDATVSSYIAQGFVVSNRTDDSVTMFKKKEFNVLWAIIGFVLCILPLLVYLIVYATQSDQMVIIQVQSAEPKWSDDRQYWWTGSDWRSVDDELPPGTKISDDRRHWWDGVNWRPVPGAAGQIESGPEA
jgi:hypothetical protein